VNIDKEAFTW